MHHLRPTTFAARPLENVEIPYSLIANVGKRNGRAKDFRPNIANIEVCVSLSRVSVFHANVEKIRFAQK